MAKLTAKQQMFVKEYLIDLNATQSAIRAGYSERTARKIGQENLTKPDIIAAIQKAMDKRSERTEITADMVLQRWWDIATADPNDLVQLRRLCCRYCFGIDHHYQWVDEVEYQTRYDTELKQAQEKEREPELPNDLGGYGFDRMLRPHPKCPKCRGEGVVDIHMEDTKHTTAKGRLLYAGIKTTQAGIEIRTQDQGKALENVARHLGMFTDRLEVNANVHHTFEDKLRELLSDG